MSQFQFLEEAAKKPHKDAVLDVGGVWRDPIFIDATGKVTDKKNQAVTTTLIAPPDDLCHWDATAQDWIYLAPEQSETVSAGAIKIHKQKLGGVLDSERPAIQEAQSVRVIKG